MAVSNCITQKFYRNLKTDFKAQHWLKKKTVTRTCSRLFLFIVKQKTGNLDEVLLIAEQCCDL